MFAPWRLAARLNSPSSAPPGPLFFRTSGQEAQSRKEPYLVACDWPSSAGWPACDGLGLGRPGSAKCQLLGPEQDAARRGMLVAAGRGVGALQGSALAAFWRSLTLREISGACGDLGTFIPLLVCGSLSLSLSVNSRVPAARPPADQPARPPARRPARPPARRPASLFLCPLQVGLVKTTGLDLGTTLIFTGLYNIITGAAFGIPMPVQVRWPC